ncbi:tetratricopeptide (TPR) repeat protein [Dysgonomonas hofstadii]|uniref:Tetratricopeptide (TPR) repeat protein n=1 Tax=Dysgonomonas hofstadii TaxID=637886 RepID=A0A840CLW1_9BACT|nr:tetratricopeptide repeat protein [Dysgonomonas hofstadii]MBB4034454.1 tetratricopeptide (TPR) repeat protein [Dysgonomonas hofstadii]
MKKFVFVLFIFIILYSCDRDSRSVVLLKQALELAENNSAEALTLLDSIPSPENLNKEHYMQYIVIKTQAKYKNYQDIHNDSLILQAQRYFVENNNNPYMCALASYYTGSYYYENENSPKELENSLLTVYYAQKTDDNLLIAKSLHSVGNIYYEKEMYNEAILNLEQALNCYEKEEHIDINKLEVIRLLLITYNSKKEKEQALYYYDKGMQLAKQNNAIDFITTFTYLRGLIYYTHGEYDIAIPFFHQAYYNNSNKEEAGRVNLSLLLSYNDMNQLDSARYYSNLLIKELPKITYLYTLRTSYKAISDYYEKVGDFKQALPYRKLYEDTTTEVYKAKNATELAEAQHRYNLALMEKEQDNAAMRHHTYMASIAGVALLIIVIVVFKNVQQKQKNRYQAERNRLLKVQLQTQNQMVEQQADNMVYMQSIYRSIVNEWVAIDKEVKKLAIEFGATEEPELYTRMRLMIENFRQNTNKQMIVQARDFFQKQPYGEAVLSSLKEKELLLFMLYYSGYKRVEVSLLLGVNHKLENMIFRKLDLKNKLLKAGMPEEKIEEVLFTENEVPKKREKDDIPI